MRVGFDAASSRVGGRKQPCVGARLPNPLVTRIQACVTVLQMLSQCPQNRPPTHPAPGRLASRSRESQAMPRAAAPPGGHTPGRPCPSPCGPPNPDPHHPAAQLSLPTPLHGSPSHPKRRYVQHPLQAVHIPNAGTYSTRCRPYCPDPKWPCTERTEMSGCE